MKGISGTMRRNRAAEGGASRRDFLVTSAAVVAAAAMPAATLTADAQARATAPARTQGARSVNTITTKDGVEIFYKDWGKGQPIVFSHGWPLSVKTATNPGGLPKEVFDGLQAQLAATRAQFYYDLPAGPFYGYNRPGAKPSQGVIWNWWRQGMMGGAKAHYDGIVAFSQTDFTEDLKRITVPVLVMHGDDDQIVPYADSAPLSARLLRNSTLKTYKGFPHGMPTTEAATINADLLAFLQA